MSAVNPVGPMPMRQELRDARDELPLNQPLFRADNMTRARRTRGIGLTKSMKEARKNSRPKAAAPRRSDNGRVVLGTACTIQEAAALKAHLLEQAAKPGPYEIDGASVAQVDTAGLQLVLAFTLDCLVKGVNYRWSGRSVTLEHAIEQLAIGALLESPGGAT